MFATENAGEMALDKDDVVEVTQKDETGSGWWLVKKNGVEGWAPSNYLELIVQAAPKPKAAPAPPVKRAAPVAPSATTASQRPAVAAKPAFGGAAAGVVQPKPVVKTTPAGGKPHERAAAVQADAAAAPVSVMPGLGAPGGFAAVLAKKKAENAAAAAAAGAGANGKGAGAPPAVAAKPVVAPKPAGSNGRAMPPPPPRR